jgi:hypothetical protein
MLRHRPITRRHLDGFCEGNVSRAPATLRPELTSKRGSKLGNSRRRAQIDRLVSEINLQATKDTLIDLVNDLQLLALRNLAPLERLFESLHLAAAEGFGRGDGDDEFAPVGGHQG